jgi:hypothetical protein
MNRAPMEMLRAHRSLSRLLRTRLPSNSIISADARRYSETPATLTALFRDPVQAASRSPFLHAVVKTSLTRSPSRRAASITSPFVHRIVGRGFATLTELRATEAEANRLPHDAAAQALYARQLNAHGYHEEVG